MTSLRPFHATDLFRVNEVNLDVLTENYHISFYLSYLAQWPTLFFSTVNSQGDITGYMMGKTEGRGKEWHGHVTCLSVAPDYRRIGLARTLVDNLERRSEDPYDAYFIDLFVRASNALAIGMYRNFGYSVYRRVVGYYGGDDTVDNEDAFDMRKPLKRDKNRESVRENGENFRVRPEDVYL
ncbi:acyl-CoA N-acyltransferase [Lipomyces orientalis]|uniref:Acyl-CoA N-acyltransferase n=1 Tax=Lipomyces orientalis TaxID=1233043 RepID=A0ACC3TIA3_9ASCO